MFIKTNIKAILIVFTVKMTVSNDSNSIVLAAATHEYRNLVYCGKIRYIIIQLLYTIQYDAVQYKDFKHSLLLVLKN